MADKETQEKALAHRGVKKDDFAKGAVQFIFPAYGYNNFLRKSVVLPDQIPSFTRYSFYTQRDYTLLSTPHHEGLWANAVAVAITKMAAWGWEVDSPVPLRRKRLQELLQYATAGVFVGWVPFISAHLRSYLLTGKALVEIERVRRGYGSKIRAIHHLNPLRCMFTDNPRYPVEYLDRYGRRHRLAYYQVMMFGDQLSPTEGDVELVESAADRAYDRIKVLEAVHRFLYEKVTGGRPLSIEFIQGLTFDKMRDAVQSADHDAARKGSIMFKGSVMVPIPGDIPVQRVSIPLAEIPNGFNYQEIFDNAAVNYAAALGMDVNDIDPRLGQRLNIGSGAQSVVLDQKARGKGLAMWRTDWTQQIHRLVAGAATTFAFSEDSTDDEVKKAQAMQARADVRARMIDSGEITAEQARNLAVDAGDLPREFIEQDATGGGRVDSDENADAQPEETADEARARGQDVTPPEPAVEKATSEALEIMRREVEQATRLATAVLQDDPLGVESEVNERELVSF